MAMFDKHLVFRFFFFPFKIKLINKIEPKFRKLLFMDFFVIELLDKNPNVSLRGENHIEETSAIFKIEKLKMKSFLKFPILGEEHKRKQISLQASDQRGSCRQGIINLYLYMIIFFTTSNSRQRELQEN